VAQLAIAWVLSRGPDIVPLVGARRRERLTEALGALSLELTADDLAAIERAVPSGAAAGDRYRYRAVTRHRRRAAQQELAHGPRQGRA
jgi:diketogulonate reductase-like aldo/keto reductase